MNFFGKKTDSKIVDLLGKILKNLPGEYGVFYRQVKSACKGVRFEKKSNYIGFRHEPSNFKFFEKQNERDYMLKGVLLISKDQVETIEMTIYVSAGMIMGGDTSKLIKKIVDVLDVQYGKLARQYLHDIADVALAKLFTDDQLRVINPSQVYEVELNGKLFYHVKDLENGDFIGVGVDKKVYRITHDPYEIKEIDGDLSKILNELSR